MLPSFRHGELILTDKISYRIRPPARGDVVVFASPSDSGKDFIKRIVGLSGEKIALRSGQIYINGVAVKELYTAQGTKTLTGSYLAENAEITISDNEYFVLGDNRSHSSDSREWGPIKKSALVGRAFIIYWPPPSFALVPQVEF